MTNINMVSGVIVDEATLTVAELANACAVEIEWVQQRVEDGFLACTATATPDRPQSWRFASAALVRARRLVSIERTFDANPEVTALVVDLLEEVAALRQQLGLDRN
jgi:chaperone modulatory protein CbpM